MPAEKIFDTRGPTTATSGLVAVVPVGMSHVASSITVTPQVGTLVAKGDELGFVQFGGSDIILVVPRARRRRGGHIDGPPKGPHDRVALPDLTARNQVIVRSPDGGTLDTGGTSVPM